MSFYSKTVAHWKMNDNAASATVVDAMGTYNGTYIDKDGDLNTDTGASTGKINGALDFDGSQAEAGTDEYIDTGNSFQSVLQGSFSISMWVKPSDGQPASTKCFIGSDNNIFEDLVLINLTTTGDIGFYYCSNEDSTGVVTFNSCFTNGQQGWHNITVVADSTIGGIGGLEIYFDGQKQTRDAFWDGDTSSVVFADFITPLDIYIGAENTTAGTPGNFLIGLIDNVMFFNVALSADEVKRIYNNGHGTEILSELDENIAPRRGTSPHGLRRRYEFA